MKHIKPALQPTAGSPTAGSTYSLSDRFNDMFGKYLPPPLQTWSEQYTEAHNDIQSDIVDDLMDEIETANLITTDSPVEINIDTDNLREWLKLYYTVEKK